MQVKRKTNLFSLLTRRLIYRTCFLSLYILGLASGILNLAAQCPDNRWDASVAGKTYVSDLGAKAYYGNYTNLLNAQHVNDGRLYFFGNITNNGYYGDGFGYEYLKSCDNQRTTLSGSGGTEFNIVEIDNPGGINIAQNIKVKNSLVFKQGILHTQRAEASHRITFYEEASYRLAADDKHINGRVAKQGQGIFTFPTGDGDHLSPVKVSGTGTFDFFVATYYSLNLSIVDWAVGGSFPAEKVALDVYRVQDKEYWTLKGASLTPITLTWTQYSEIDNLTQDPKNLIVVGWDGDKWVNLGNTATSAFLGTGTVTSELVLPNQYSAFTFGVADTDADGYVDEEDPDPLDPCNPDPSSEYCQQRICLEVDIEVFLEGALIDGGIGIFDSEMKTRLNYFGYLPGQKPRTLLGQATASGQPYGLAPWNYLGSEGQNIGSIDPLYIPYAENVVDWVLVSLRTTEFNNSTVCKKAALVLTDGSVVMTEFFDCCDMDQQEYYIVIEHRNHLPVMTPTPIPIVDGILSFDFRSQQSFTKLLGRGQKEVLPGVFAMYGGNGDQDLGSESPKDINTNDFSRWTEDNGKHSGYYFRDFDLNGDVNVHDQALWLQNNGIFTDVDL